jgi:regulator of sigma E protease
MGVTLISFAVVLGILIFVHELGHFIVAKSCGVGVEKFSIGFGPKIFGWKKGRTDYMISAIPLGGYVKMVGEEPDAEIEEEEIKYSFTHKNVWQRFVIVAAGPVFNFLLAVVLYFILYLIYGTYFYPPVIGEIEKNAPAYSANLQTGDVVESLNGKDVESWSEFEKMIKKSDGNKVQLRIKRNSDIKDIYLTPIKLSAKSIFGEDIKEYSIGAKPYFPPVIGNIKKDSPADLAGVEQGDRVVEIAGEQINTWHDVSRLISDSGGSVEIVLMRNGDRIKKEILPEKIEQKNHLGQKETRNMIGIAAQDISMHKKIGPIKAFSQSMGQTWKVIELTFSGIVKMINGTVSKDNLGGPILIAQMAGDQAKMGVTNLLVFIALISINLGLLNLLPIPVLDGGHLMFFLIEGITGRPVSLRVRQGAQQIGLFLLLSLMVYAFYNDIVRVLTN